MRHLHSLLRPLPLAVLAASFCGQAAACLIMPGKEAVKLTLAGKPYVLQARAVHKNESDPWPHLDLRSCEGVSVTAGEPIITAKGKDGGVRVLRLAAGKNIAEELGKAKPQPANEAAIQLGALLRGDPVTQHGLSRGEPAVPGMPFGKILRPGDALVLAIAHATPQTLVLTPPLTARREPLTLSLAPGNTARVPADFLVPGGVYRWRLERDGVAREGRFTLLDAAGQQSVEAALAAVQATTPDGAAMLRALALDAAGLEYDRDLAATAAQ